MSHDKIQRLIDSLAHSSQDADLLKFALCKIRCDPELFQSFVELDPSISWAAPTQSEADIKYLESTETEAHSTLGSYPIEVNSALERELLDATLTPSNDIEPDDTLSLADFKGDSTAPPTTKLSLLSMRRNLKADVEGSSLGRYGDLGILGRGGMGEVRRVRDHVLNRNVAMKIIDPKLLTRQVALSRFIEEAQVGAQLQHPNIVPVHELGQLEDGRYYFTMKEVRGADLSSYINAVHEASTAISWLATPDGITLRTLIQLFHKTCETMAFAHSLNVIHRDLKPRNIMIGDFGEIVVVDWGLAKVIKTSYSGDPQDLRSGDVIYTDRSITQEQLTEVGMISGTPAYMSPEQANGQSHLITYQSDIYTLGVILYEILVGKTPHTGESPQEILDKVRSASPIPLLNTSSSHNNASIRSEDETLIDLPSYKVPSSLIKICERCLQREITDRYLSVKELADDIFNWLEGAHKKDQAIHETASALKSLTSASLYTQEGDRLWREAYQWIENLGTIDTQGWALKLSADEAYRRAKECRDVYQKKLHDALVHDLTSEEANTHLAKLLVSDIVKATALGHQRECNTLWVRFNEHLQHVPLDQQSSLRDQVYVRCRDEVDIRRAKRGTLIGRQSLRADLVNEITSGTRLISLVGTAGVGKTRLILDVVHDLRELSHDDDDGAQVIFCDLTESTSDLELAFALAKEMDLVLQHQDPLEQLGALFAQQRVVLILDKVEHITQEVGEVLQTWFRQSRFLQVITTSRSRLKMQIERVFSIGPLSVLEAFELFIQRALEADSNFDLHPEPNHACHDQIMHIITQVDRLPLAIELACARLNILSLDDLASRLLNGFKVLRSRDPDLPALEGALDWSWGLLEPWLRSTLTQLSVFRGGFTLGAADHVLELQEWRDAPPLIDLLQDLCESSLIRQTRSLEGETRYSILESIRHYAERKIRDATSLQELMARHARCFAELGERLLSEDHKIHDVKPPTELFIELDNLAIATERALGLDSIRCCLAAMKILNMRGPLALGLELAQHVSSLTDQSKDCTLALQLYRIRFLRETGQGQAARQAKLFMIQGDGRLQRLKLVDSPTLHISSALSDELLSDLSTINRFISQVKAYREDDGREGPASDQDLHLNYMGEHLLEYGRIEEAESRYDLALVYAQYALTIYKHLGIIRGQVQVLLEVSKVHRTQGEPSRALSEIEKLFRLLEREPDASLRADALSEQGRCYSDLGQFEQALHVLTQSLELSRSSGDKAQEAHTLGNLSSTYKALGYAHQALRKSEDALALHRELGNLRGEVRSLGTVALIHRNAGQLTEAISEFDHIFNLSQQIGDQKTQGIALACIANALEKLGDHRGALDYYERALEITREIGNKRDECITLGLMGIIFMTLDDLDEAQRYLSSAIELSAQRIPHFAGYFMGFQGRLCAERGELASALELIREGETLVCDDPLKYAQFLCEKSRVLCAAQDLDAARQAIVLAEELVDRLDISTHSYIDKARAYLHSMIQ